ncbi:cytochrome-c peroxidase [Lewinellaceae bacterium SD302]|nr:cytochrome-c peroxidase [Lewinellaceae bacterium SD302]
MRGIIIFTITTSICYLSLLLPFGMSTEQSSANRGRSELEAARLAVIGDFKVGLDKLSREIELYQQVAATEQVAQLRQQHAATREAFKRVEWLLEYIDPTAVKRFINGAPLPKTEPHVPAIVIIEPSGLQRLDELVWEEEPDFAAVRKMLNKLQREYADLQLYARNRRLQHRQLFEALRLEVVRIFTLGVSGFDTPASGLAMTENLATLLAIDHVYDYYAESVEEQDAILHRRIVTALRRGEELLSGADFNTFNRLTFLTEVINPLTSGLVDAQELLEVEFSAAARNPVNPRAKLLFGADWLNADVYAKLPLSDYEAARVELGRLLFFDPILSTNNQRACASCHLPEKAFTDGSARSLALDREGTILRNSPTLINSVFAEKFFYDLREERLDRQIKHVVHDSLEFATDFIEIVEKLSQSEEYVALFRAAYPENPDYMLSRYSVSDALGRFVKSLRAHNSPFDRMARGEAAADSEVAAGFNLFMGKAACGTCHFAPTFSGLVPPYFRESESEVLGVPATKVWENAQIDSDLGRLTNSKPGDEAYFHAFSFKTPTVRNAALTAPYMHNGVYAELEEVMDFYNRGGGAGIGSFVDHQTLPPDALELDTEEIGSLITFMEALTDTSGLTKTPIHLPEFSVAEWNGRRIGGEY